MRCREKVFNDGKVGLVVFEYAIESRPFYRLLKDSPGRIFCVAFADGEESVVKIMYVDEEHEGFVYDLLSTNFGDKYRGMQKEAAYAAQFANLVSARLEG